MSVILNSGLVLQALNAEGWAGHNCVSNKSSGNLRTTGSFHDRSLDSPPITVTKCTCSCPLNVWVSPGEVLSNLCEVGVTTAPISPGCREDPAGEAVTPRPDRDYSSADRSSLTGAKSCL